MDKELEKIWSKQLAAGRLEELKEAIGELQEVKVPSDLKPKLMAISEQQDSVFDLFRPKLIATFACLTLVFALVINYQKPTTTVSNQLTYEASDEEFIEELTYIFDDSNFDLFVFNSGFEYIGEELI